MIYKPTIPAGYEEVEPDFATRALLTTGHIVAYQYRARLDVPHILYFNGEQLHLNPNHVRLLGITLVKKKETV